MELVADILMIAGAGGAAVYCMVLSRRLRRLSTLEGGMGAAIAVLSAQVDEMTRALEKAQSAAGASVGRLEEQTRQAEAAARRMELLMAAQHDLAAPPQGVGDPLGVAAGFAGAAGEARAELSPEASDLADAARRPRIVRRRPQTTA